MFESIDEVEQADPAALAHVVFDLSDGEVAQLPLAAAEALVAATQRVLSALAARQAAAIETVARRCDQQMEVARVEAAAVGARLPHVSADHVAAGSLAALLHVSPRTMARRVRHARQLVCLMPSIQDAAWAGDLETYRVDAVVRESDGVSPARLHEFEARVLTRDITQLSCSALRRWARRCAERCNADDGRTVGDRARELRSVRITPGEVAGMTTLTAQLPSPTAQRLWSAIDALASEYVRAQPGRLVGAARADALCALVEGSATIRTTVELVAPIDCEARPWRPRTTASPSCRQAQDSVRSAPAQSGEGLFGSDARERDQGPFGADAMEGDDYSIGSDALEDWSECEDLRDGQLHTHRGVTWFVASGAQVPGVGSLLPTDVVALLNDPDVTVRLARTDLYTGAVRWQDPSSYRPGARVARAVRSRDGTCRFPGCATPARRCQLDHVVRHPDGPTDVANLQCLCATHHGFKHHAGWTVEMTREGICTWTAPDGRTHTTTPLDRHGSSAAA